MDRLLTTVPFAGFFRSVHGDALEQELSQSFSDDSGEPIDSLVDLARDAICWREAYRLYAKGYVENLAWDFRLGLEFESLSLPREYNFESDRVFAYIHRATLAQIWRDTPRETFEDHARARFTSRDGFRSHYSNDWRDWGRLSEWDHNQIGTLLGAYLEAARGEPWDMWAEHALMESDMCNGQFGHWLNLAAAGAPKWERAWRIRNYLDDRAARPYRTRAARRAANLPFAELPLWGALA